MPLSLIHLFNKQETTNCNTTVTAPPPAVLSLGKTPTLTVGITALSVYILILALISNKINLQVNQLFQDRGSTEALGFIPVGGSTWLCSPHRTAIRAIRSHIRQTAQRSQTAHTTLHFQPDKTDPDSTFPHHTPSSGRQSVPVKRLMVFFLRSHFCVCDCVCRCVLDSTVSFFVASGIEFNSRLYNGAAMLWKSPLQPELPGTMIQRFMKDKLWSWRVWAF